MPNSNFGVKHLTDLLAGSPKYIPSINQVVNLFFPSLFAAPLTPLQDLHPFMTRNELVAYCESQKIVLEAWAPLVRGERFDHPDIVRLAKKYNKSPAQILIRYGLDRVSLRPVGAGEKSS